MPGTARSNSQRTNAYIGKGIIGPGGAASRVLRAAGQNMTLIVGAYGIGAGQRATRFRLPHKILGDRVSKVKFRYQLFDPKAVAAGDIRDTKFTQAMGIQCGIEPVFAQAISGLAARTLAPFASLRHFAFDPASLPADQWFAETDLVDLAAILGRYLTTGDVIGSHTAIEVPAGGDPQLLPRQRNVSNAKQRWIGSSNSTASIIPSYSGDAVAEAALTAAAYTASSTNVTGVLTGFGPCEMIVEAAPTFVSMLGSGDSVTEGQKEGYDPDAPAMGDIMGDADGNTAFFMRAAARLGVAGINFGRGSDGNKNLVDPTKWQGRRSMVRDGEITCVDLLNGLNDLAGYSTPLDWTASTAYVVAGIIRKNGGKVFMSQTIGTTGTVGPTAAALGDTFVDGTVTWVCLGTLYGNAKDGGFQGVGAIKRVADQFRAKLPKAWIRYMLPLTRTNDAGSSDSWATPESQTVNTAWRYDNVRGGLIELMSNPIIQAFAGIDAGLIDVRAAIEDLSTGKHLTNGTANWCVDDGVHPHSRFHDAMAARYPAPPAPRI